MTEKIEIDIDSVSMGDMKSKLKMKEFTTTESDQT